MRTGFCSSVSSSESLSLLDAAFLADFLGADSSEASESESLDSTFLAAFLAGAAFFPLITSTSSLSSELSSLSLTTFFLGSAFLTGAFLVGLASSSDESSLESSELSCFLADFFDGTALALLVFAAFLPLLELALEALEVALALLAITLGASSSEEEESSELLTTTFLTFFLSLVESTDCFLATVLLYGRN